MGRRSSGSRSWESLGLALRRDSAFAAVGGMVLVCNSGLGLKVGECVGRDWD